MDHICTYGISEFDYGYLVILLTKECCCLTANHSASDYQYFLTCCTFSFQQIRSVNDRRIVNAFNRQYQCLGTGCKNHAVRVLLFDEVCCHLVVQFYLNSIFLATMNIAADHICNITFSRWISCKTHVSTKFRTCFV